MELHFVAMRGDLRGEAALEILAALGERTILLTEGEKAPEGSIALFTPTGPIVPEARTGEGKERTRGRGKYYLCCSAVQLKPVTPPWARSTPFLVGIKSTVDRKPGKSGGGTFKFALQEMMRMYRYWDWSSESLAPWIRTERYPAARLLLKTLENLRAWRKNSAAKALIERSKGDLVVCQQIREELDQSGGYYVSHPSKALQISPDFFPISSGQRKLAERRGPALWNFWEEALALYLESLRNPGLEWVAASVEGPINPVQQEWQRQIAWAQPKTLPLFLRADLSSIGEKTWFLVEIQERIGGKGLIESWTRAIRTVQGTKGLIGDPRGFAHTFAEVVRSATGRRDPVVALICPEGYEAEQTFFAEALEPFGVEAFVVLKEEIGQQLMVERGYICLGKRGPRVDLLYRREINAASMALTPIGQEIMKAVLEGKLIVEPPLNMLYDCKSPMAWPHHPETGSYFSTAVGTVISPTALMPADWDTSFLLAGEWLTLGEILGRPYVVKYGGESIKYGFGGRAVYQTADNDEGIQRGLKEVSRGHSWVVQPRDRATYEVREWDPQGNRLRTRKVAARLMFHYARNPQSGKVTLAVAAATNRPDHWKAIGCPEAIFQEIRVVKGR